MLLASPARADADDARELYERGAYAYRLQHWEDALDRFQAAYGASQAPEILFNIGQCQRQLGQFAAAAHSYRAYLAQVPEGGDRAAAERLAAEMDAEAAAERAAKQPAASPPRAEVAPRDAPAAPPSAAVDAPAPRRRTRVAGWVLGGVGLAVAAAGGIVLALGARDDGAARRAATLPDQRQLWDRGGELHTAGIVALAVGGAELVAAGVLLARRR
jgi:tetratricopeptide (TPR) repeat protein